MPYNYQYRLRPTTEQKLVLNDWLRICRYWYNRQLGERFDWWEHNRSYVDRCLLVCHLPELKDKPNYYNQKKQLPIIKKELVKVSWSGESLDMSSVPSQTLQEVGKRVELAFKRYISGDYKNQRSGKPRFKSTSRFRSMIFEGAKLHSCSVEGKWLYLILPKLARSLAPDGDAGSLTKMGVVKIRHHRPLPDGAILKSIQIIKKADGWYINLRLKDSSIPDFKPDITPTWENSLGMDAVLHEDDYLATSEGFKLPSLKSFRKSQSKLAKVSRRKAHKNKGSKARRLLAKKEAKLHQKIARSRKDHAYNTAQKLLETGKQVFFHEKLNLKGLSQKNRPKQDESGKYIPNGQSAKSGLNKSWVDAGFGQFFEILKYKAEKAGAVVIPVNPQYTSQVLPYKDKFVFTDVSIREYWDEEFKLLIDRDISSGINIKRVGLGLFPTIKRCKGKTVVTNSCTNLTSKEVLSTLRV